MWIPGDPHPLDDCPMLPAPDPWLGSASYVSDRTPDGRPFILIPNPEAPSQYVEHYPEPRRRPIGFG